MTGSRLALEAEPWQTGTVVNEMQQKRLPRVLLCVALSLLLHVILALILPLLLPQEKVKRQEKPRKARAVQVLRTTTRKKADEQAKLASQKLKQYRMKK